MGQVISTAMKTVNKGMAWFTDPWLRVGNRVEVNFKGYGKWYPGKIGEVAKGKYTINYDDGDVELVSDLARIRREPGPNDCDLFGKRYSAGAEVMARWGGGAAWYPATIQSVDEVRRYTVEYEDGETEKLPSSSLKARTTQSADVPSAQFGWVVGKAYAIARPVIEPILKPIRELLEKPIELGDALSINYRNAGTMYTAKVIGIETASPTAPFPIRVKYDDDQEKQTIEYADRHLIKRSSGAADSDLGYSYTILRPSALRLREAFESEDTHRFRMGERVVLIGVQLTFTVAARLKGMVRLSADTSGMPADDSLGASREFYFPEQHSWLQREEDMRAGADADLYTVPNDVRNDAESRLKSFPTRQAKFDEITRLCGLNPGDDATKPRTLKEPDIAKLEADLEKFNAAERERLHDSYCVLKGSAYDYDEDEKAAARKKIDDDGRLVRKALDPAVNGQSRRSFLHWVELDTTYYVRIAEVLLGAGASANVYDFNGMTPLYLACIKGEVQIADFLLARGADALLPGPGMLTPLHMMMSPKFNMPDRLVAPGLRNLRTRTGRAIIYDFSYLQHYTLPAPVATPIFRLEDINDDGADNDVRSIIADLGDEKSAKRQAVVESALTVIVRDGNFKALGTPVVQQLLDHKWTLFASAAARRDALSSILLAFFMLLDTTLHSHALKANANCNDFACAQWRYTALLSLGIWAWTGVLLVIELRSIGENLALWSLDVWNPIEGAAYAFVFAYESAALAGLRGQLTEAQDGWVPTLRAISAMLVWLRILKYVSMFPRAGHLVNIVVKMLFEFMIFLIVFSTIFAAFTHAFVVLLEPTAGLQGGDALIDTIVLAFRTIMGDFEYDKFQGSYFLIALFVVYVLFASVLMLNLLIAQLSNVFAEVQATADQEYLLNKARFISEKENGLTGKQQRSVSAQRIIYKANGVMPEELATSLAAEADQREAENRRRAQDRLVSIQLASYGITISAFGLEPTGDADELEDEAEESDDESSVAPSTVRGSKQGNGEYAGGALGQVRPSATRRGARPGSPRARINAAAASARKMIMPKYCAPQMR